MARSPNWFCTQLPILKCMQIVCALVVVLFFLDGRQQWTPYTLIFLLAILTIIGNLILLALHYFEVVRTNKSIPWLSVELFWNGLLAIVYLVATVTLAIDWWKLRNNTWTHYPPKNIGAAGWTSRVLCVLVGCLVNVVLFALLLQRLRVHKLQ